MSQLQPMSDEQVEAELARLPEWSSVNETIQRTFQFKTFAQSMSFVSAIAATAEADQHHPDILIRWNKVTLTFSTHDAGGITHKDFAAAAKADALGGR
jgi:4a-hydroxytetrahydrobiopterin dehydratase